MKIERTHVGWGFWFWWVLASTVGYAVGNAAGMKVVQAVVGAAEYRAKGFVVAIPLLVVMTGAAVGVMQWLVLRRAVSGAGGWVLASIGGWVMGQAAHWAIGMPAVGAVSGAITGIALVRLLRQPIAEA